MIGIPILFFAVIGTIIIGAIIYWVLSAQTKRMLGNPALDVDPGICALGDRVSCGLRSRVEGRIRVEEIALTFRCIEHVSWRETETDTDSHGHTTTRTVTRTATHEVWRAEEKFPVRREYLPGEDLALNASFEIPPAAPPSFEAPDNAIRWIVSYNAVVPGLPDPHGDRRIVVQPILRSKPSEELPKWHTESK